MKLVPLFARVLLDRPKKERIGSIILPSIAQKQYASLKCRVLACGQHCEPEIKDLTGKHVLIGRNAGAWLDKDGNPLPHEGDADDVAFFIVQEQDILCAVDDE